MEESGLHFYFPEWLVELPQAGERLAVRMNVWVAVVKRFPPKS
jgi:hypothetical protein